MTDQSQATKPGAALSSCQMSLVVHQYQVDRFIGSDTIGAV